MSRVRSRDTKPELLLRKALWAEGFRYRLRSRLPGKPDLVFRGDGLVVFVDGCFWHGCPIHSTQPKTNATFWSEKLEANVSRDVRVTAELRVLGWTVLRIWQHQIQEDLDSALDLVRRHLHKQRI